MAISRSNMQKQISQAPAKRTTAMKRGGKITRLTPAEKYRQLKAQTEAAGMSVEEKNGKIVVSRRRKK